MRPPSKYDLCYDSTLGARWTSVLAAVAGVSGPGTTVVFARMAL